MKDRYRIAGVLMLAATVWMALSVPPFFANPVHGRLVRRDTTGHFYVWIGNALRWDEADRFARSYAVKLDDGFVLENWHLATITDSGENDFIFEAVLNRGGSAPSFVGAIVRDGSLNNFQWVTGEKFGYTNFAPGQPDVERENVLEIGGAWGAQWNNQDGPGSPGELSQPFILEHEPVSELVSVFWYPLTSHPHR